MICYKDRTFCQCGNCDRSLTAKDREVAKALGLPISFGNLCGEGIVYQFFHPVPSIKNGQVLSIKGNDYEVLEGTKVVLTGKVNYMLTQILLVAGADTLKDVAIRMGIPEVAIRGQLGLNRLVNEEQVLESVPLVNAIWLSRLDPEKQEELFDAALTMLPRQFEEACH